MVRLVVVVMLDLGGGDFVRFGSVLGVSWFFFLVLLVVC